jgi:regulator of protease activity HflC (stomatin/prohibitin superfamily)
MDGFLVALIIITVIAILFGYIGIQKVPDGSSRIVERLGRRHKIMMPGIGVIIPFIDSIKKDAILETYVGQEPRALLNRSTGNVSMAEQRMDPPELRSLVCSDGSLVNVDAVAYFRISDPMKIVYDVAAFSETFRSLTETTLRQEVGRYDGDAIITSRDTLSENLRSVLQEASTSWGITVLRVEVEKIEFEGEIQVQLARARAEELVRRAEMVTARQKADQLLLEAEAAKGASITRAEGERQAEVEKAEGDKLAQVLRAQAQFEQEKLEAEGKFLLASREQEGLAQGYKAIVEALSDSPEGLVALKALEAQEQVAKALGESNNTLIIPSETAGLFGAIGSIQSAIKSLERKT